jgi:hypothetical protein
MAMSFTDIKFMLRFGAYPRDEHTTGPFRILTEEENAQVDNMMGELLGEKDEDQSDDD